MLIVLDIYVIPKFGVSVVVKGNARCKNKLGEGMDKIMVYVRMLCMYTAFCILEIIQTFRMLAMPNTEFRVFARRFSNLAGDNVINKTHLSLALFAKRNNAMLNSVTHNLLFDQIQIHKLNIGIAGG